MKLQDGTFLQDTGNHFHLFKQNKYHGMRTFVPPVMFEYLCLGINYPLMKQGLNVAKHLSNGHGFIHDAFLYILL